MYMKMLKHGEDIKDDTKRELYREANRYTILTLKRKRGKVVWEEAGKMKDTDCMVSPGERRPRKLHRRNLCLKKAGYMKGWQKPLSKK